MEEEKTKDEKRVNFECSGCERRGRKMRNYFGP
jgi:hypothetical protein